MNTCFWRISKVWNAVREEGLGVNWSMRLYRGIRGRVEAGWRGGGRGMEKNGGSVRSWFIIFSGVGEF